MPPSRKVLAGATVMEEMLPLLPLHAAASLSHEMRSGSGFSSIAVRQRLHPRRPARGRLHHASPRLDRILLFSFLPSAAAEWMVTPRSEVCA